MKQFTLLFCCLLAWTQLQAQCSLNPTTSDPSCGTVCDGTINPNPTGGTMPYTYLWNDGGTQNQRSGLCGGTFSVTVTDALGCTVSNSFTLTQPSNITANVGQTPETCAGNDGTASVNPSGGTPGYTYLWTSGATTNSISGLASGTYTVTINDANGCSRVSNITVFNTCPPCATSTLSIAGASSSNPSCGTVCDGNINPNTTGGTAPYTYVWNDGGTQSQRSGLCGGTFSVTVTDAAGCTVSNSFTLNQPSNITANVAQTPETCAGNDGTASVNPSGGSPSYTYLWGNGATTSSITGLAAGTYTVTITDASGCGRISNITVFNSCPPCNLSTSASASPASCAGICTGAATTFPSNGAAPFSYLWSEGSTTQSATGLCPGVYTVTVTDDNNCTATATANVGSSSNVSISINGSDETCNGNDGSAVAITTGGLSPYSYAWSTGATTDTLVNLVQGNYSVTATDGNGCTASNSVSIGFNNTLAVGTPVIVQQVACFGEATGQAFVPNGGTGFTYLWSTGEVQDTAFALVGGINQVTVTSPNGCSRVRTVVIQQPSTALSSTASSNVLSSCDSFGVEARVQATGGTGSYSYLWSTGATTNSIDSVQATSYSVTVTDANGCTDVSNVTVPTIAVPPSISIAVVDTPNCSNSNDGALDLTVNTGTAASFLWSNNSTTEDIAGLTVGNYTVVVTDTNGCALTESFTLTGPAPLNVTINRTPPSNPNTNDGLLTATANGGTPPYQYQWDDVLGTTGAILAGVNNGTYSVTVTDGNGCTDSVSFNVTPVLTTTTELGSLSWKLFPNPNRGSFQVEWQGDLQVHAIQVFDVLGRAVYQEQIPVATAPHRVDLEGLPSGQYLLRLETEGGFHTTPFIIRP